MTATYARAVPDNELISRAEAARILDVSLETVGRYARTGRLTRHHNSVTLRVAFERAEVERLRDERKEWKK